MYVCCYKKIIITLIYKRLKLELGQKMLRTQMTADNLIGK